MLISICVHCNVFICCNKLLLLSCLVYWNIGIIVYFALFIIAHYSTSYVFIMWCMNYWSLQAYFQVQVIYDQIASSNSRLTVNSWCSWLVMCSWLAVIVLLTRDIVIIKMLWSDVVNVHGIFVPGVQWVLRNKFIQGVWFLLVILVLIQGVQIFFVPEFVQVVQIFLLLITRQSVILCLIFWYDQEYQQAGSVIAIC